MNPFEGDADFVYLAIDKKKMLAEQQPFDGKKNCWIPHAKEGYIRCEIQSTKGDDVTVVDGKGAVRVAFSSIFKFLFQLVLISLCVLCIIRTVVKSLCSIFTFRNRPSRRMRSSKWILPNSRCARIWPIWPTWTRLLYWTTLGEDTKADSSTWVLYEYIILYDPPPPPPVPLRYERRQPEPLMWEEYALLWRPRLRF